MRFAKWFALTLVVALAVGAAWASDRAGHYKIDPAHSQATFKIKHLGISWVTGRFDKLQGSFEYNPDNLSESKVEAAIEASSVDTDVQQRDDHLRSPDFFDVATYPEIKFVSKSVQAGEAGKFQILGDLTIHGVTRPVTLDSELGGTVKDPWGNVRAAFSGSTTINRKDFGLTWNKALEAGGLLVGEEVHIQVSVEGVQAK